jgi:hypothetical protein
VSFVRKNVVFHDVILKKLTVSPVYHQIIKIKNEKPRQDHKSPFLKEDVPFFIFHPDEKYHEIH